VDSAQSLAREALAAQVGARFAIRGGRFDGTVLSLAQVEVHRPSAPGYETFSLFFEGPREAPLEQATYDLESDAFGVQAVFLVPVAPVGERRRYEAVFNRPAA
jgi:hypothetical protein